MAYCVPEHEQKNDGSIGSLLDIFSPSIFQKLLYEFRSTDILLPSHC